MNNANQQPLVSVILPVYNASTFLKESIDSVLNQTYTNFELIIINDASTDDSDIIISSYDDSRICHFKNSENLKLIKTLNKGIYLAKGKYIARMDADDICYPNRLEEQISFLENNPEYILVGSSAKVIDERGIEKNDLVYFSEHEDIVFASLFYSPIIHPSAVIRKGGLDDFNLKYDESYIHVEDYELWTRMLFFGKFKNLKKNLLKYRVHSTQISTLHNSEQLKMNKLIQQNFAKKLFAKLKDFEVDFLLDFSSLDNFLHRLNILSLSINNQLLNSTSYKNYIKSRIKNEILNISHISKSELIQLHLKYLKFLLLLNLNQYFALLKKSIITKQ